MKLSSAHRRGTRDRLLPLPILKGFTSLDPEHSPRCGRAAGAVLFEAEEAGELRSIKAEARA